MFHRTQLPIIQAKKISQLINPRFDKKKKWIVYLLFYDTKSLIFTVIVCFKKLDCGCKIDKKDCVFTSAQSKHSTNFVQHRHES